MEFVLRLLGKLHELAWQIAANAIQVRNTDYIIRFRKNADGTISMKPDLEWTKISLEEAEEFIRLVHRIKTSHPETK
jgi:hypothetical protein